MSPALTILCALATVVGALVAVAPAPSGGVAAASVRALAGVRDAARGSIVLDLTPELEDASEQLTHARFVEDGLNGATGRDRLRVRLQTIEAMRAVHGRHAGLDDVRARAALAAGAHLSTLGFGEEALLEHDIAVRLAGDEELRYRARLERARSARRTERWERALVDFRWCAEHSRGAERIEALLYEGEAQERLGFEDLAREVWQRALIDAVPCTATVDVYDRLARAALARGDEDGAATWLEDCRRGLGDALRATTPTGTALRRAVVGMRARYELQCAVGERSVRAPLLTNDDDGVADES
ncbi:hypothetical protein Pla163_34510 [Planctomycetes bacterium Pla163]|uniref:Tetratricopeptide repeat protein n=1 Tax=Rohdeia mirabilis TaxID=2528008 RepID=A0A518D4A4_9BACT|nr:hypothetical protein Pla163_34510 [Planctomycetes bacterium Pla163]